MFYVDAIKFKDKVLAKACAKLMVRKFAEIQEEAQEYLLRLPKKYFIMLCSSDHLNLENEN